jgi:uncharacterized protein HemX
MKFSIRDVLWLTVAVALAVGWGLDRVQFRREQVNARRAELRAKLEVERALAESQRAQYMAELARASTALERVAETQLQSTDPPPDPLVNPLPATTAP